MANPFDEKDQIDLSFLPVKPQGQQNQHPQPPEQGIEDIDLSFLPVKPGQDKPILLFSNRARRLMEQGGRQAPTAAPAGLAERDRLHLPEELGGIPDVPLPSATAPAESTLGIAGQQLPGAAPSEPGASLAGEALEAIPGGFINTLEMYGRAARVLDIPGADKVIEFAKKMGSDFQPKRDDLLAGAVRGGIESTIQSVMAGLPGALAGSLGGIVGAVGGFALSAGTLFGLAEYDQFMEDLEKTLKAKGVKPNEIKKIKDDFKLEASISALSEFTFETISNLLQAKILGFLGKKGVSNVAKRAFKDFLKEAARKYGLSVATELPTELATTATQIKMREMADIPTQGMLRGLVETVGPVLVQTLITTAGGHTLAELTDINKELEDPNTPPERRAELAKRVGELARKELEKAKQEAAVDKSPAEQIMEKVVEPEKKPITEEPVPQTEQPVAEQQPEPQKGIDVSALDEETKTIIEEALKQAQKPMPPAESAEPEAQAQPQQIPTEEPPVPSPAEASQQPQMQPEGRQEALPEQAGGEKPTPSPAPITPGEQEQPTGEEAAPADEIKNAKVYELNIKDIETDEDRFQNRLTAFSEKTAATIAERYDPNLFDPIVVWRDPKDGKVYVLSGHSRLEGMRRRGAKSIPVRFFEGSEEDAIRFAKLEANRLGTAENLTETLNAFREAKKRNLSKKRLVDLFDGDVGWLDAAINLDAKGDFIKMLSQPQMAESGFPYIRRFARWVGEARKMYGDKFTDRHEQQIFDFFYKDESGRRNREITKEEFFALLDKQFQRLDFNREQPLILKRSQVPKAGTRGRKDTAKLEEKLDQLRADLKNARTVQEREAIQKEIDSVTRALSEIVRTQKDLFAATEEQPATEKPKPEAAEAEVQSAAAKKRSEKKPEPESKQPVDFEEMIKEAARWKGAALKASKVYGDDKQGGLRHSRMTTKADLDRFLMKRFGIDEATARSVSNALTERNIPADESANIKDFANEPWAKAALEYEQKRGKKPWEKPYVEFIETEKPAGKNKTYAEIINETKSAAAHGRARNAAIADYQKIVNEARDRGEKIPNEVIEDLRSFRAEPEEAAKTPAAEGKEKVSATPQKIAGIEFEPFGLDPNLKADEIRLNILPDKYILTQEQRDALIDELRGLDKYFNKLGTPKATAPKGVAKRSAEIHKILEREAFTKQDILSEKGQGSAFDPLDPVILTSKSEVLKDYPELQKEATEPLPEKESQETSEPKPAQEMTEDELAAFLENKMREAMSREEAETKKANKQINATIEEDTQIDHRQRIRNAIYSLTERGLIEADEAAAVFTIYDTIANNVAKLLGVTPDKVFQRIERISYEDEENVPVIHDALRTPDGTRGNYVVRAKITIQSGKAIFRLYKRADVDSLLHEYAHFIRRLLPEEDAKKLRAWAEEGPHDVRRLARKYINAEQWDELNKKYPRGKKDAEFKDELRKLIGEDQYQELVDWAIGKAFPENRSWSVEAEEKYALAFEKYIKTKELPSRNKLRKIFEKIREVMTAIHAAIRKDVFLGKIKLNKQIIEHFDQLLGIDEKQKEAVNNGIEQETKAAKDETEKPSFKKGDRVEIVNGQYKGRHGEIISEKVATIKSMSGEVVDEFISYQVKTDNGKTATLDPEEIKRENKRPDSIIEDIYDEETNYFFTADEILDEINRYQNQYELYMARSKRRRKASYAERDRREASNAKKQAKRLRQLFDEWAKKYPAEAARLLEEKGFSIPKNVKPKKEYSAPTAKAKEGITEDEIFVKINGDKEKDFVSINFSEKPSNIVIKALKEHGFKWFPSKGEWRAKWKNSRWEFLNSLIVGQSQKLPDEILSGRTEDETKLSIRVENSQIKIDFSEKPSEKIRNRLKANKFRWNPRESVWYAPYKKDRYEFAKSLITAEFKSEVPQGKEPAEQQVDKFYEGSYGTVKVSDDGDINIRFPGTPSESVRDRLKSMGFSPAVANKLWFAPYSDEAYNFAVSIVSEQEPEQPAAGSKADEDFLESIKDLKNHLGLEDIAEFVDIYTEPKTIKLVARVLANVIKKGIKDFDDAVQLMREHLPDEVLLNLDHAIRFAWDELKAIQSEISGSKAIKEIIGEKDVVGTQERPPEPLQGETVPEADRAEGEGTPRGDNENVRDRAGEAAEAGENPIRLPSSGVGVAAPITSGERTDFDRGTKVADAATTDFRFSEEHVSYLESNWRPIERFENNVRAIEVLKQLEEEGRQATPEEQSILAKYVGWGGLSEVAFGYGRRHDRQGELRRKLRALLTDEEYETARSSTLNAHYTSIPIIRSIYRALHRIGLPGNARILEPGSGIGNFFGARPSEFANLRFIGIEMDPISARIAKHLYPQQMIINDRFEKAPLANNSFDGMIGNVPFGNIKISDPEIQRKYGQNFTIHNYFIIKSLDKVREGGVIAVITSRFTMDGQKNEHFRRLVAEQADFLGAIRLPQEAFEKNANTSVVTDIIFLRKRKKGEKPSELNEQWIKSEPTPFPDGDKAALSLYYHNHPEMEIGERGWGRTTHFEHGPVWNFKGDVGKEILRRIENLPENIFQKDQPRPDEKVSVEADNTIDLPQDARIYIDQHVLTKDGDIVAVDEIELTYNEKGEKVKRVKTRPVELKKGDKQRMKELISLRTLVRDILHLESQEKVPEAEKLRKKLNTVYDRFRAKYGELNSPKNRKLIVSDPDVHLILNLERYDEASGKYVKAAIFEKATVAAERTLAVNTPKTAYIASLAQKGYVDIPWMAERLKMDEQEIIDALYGQFIFHDPAQDKYVPADEYLSGNVREKLETANEFAKDNERYKTNVEALEKVQPENVPIHEIDLRLGGTWHGTAIIEAFANSLASGGKYSDGIFEITYNQATASFKIKVGKFYNSRYDYNAASRYNVGNLDLKKLLNYALNMREPVIKKEVRDADGRTQKITDLEATEVAKSKIRELNQEFAQWILEDPERSKEIERLYNKSFNNIRLREYDGSHLTRENGAFVGMNPEIELRDYQKNAIWRILTGGNTMVAHTVGAGKTFVMIAAGMEAKRLGLANKPVFFVKNSMVQQFADDFRKLYPNANILVADTQGNFAKAKRRKFFAQIATGDWDGVIFPHSAHTFLELSPSYQRKIINEELASLRSALEEAKAEDKSEGKGRKRSLTVKKIEAAIERLETKLSELTENIRRDNLYFEELGIDMIFFDESQERKNLAYTTKMNRVLGMGKPEGGPTTMDLYMKTRYLSEKNGEWGVVFATGTPISNSVSEMYLIMKFLRPFSIKKIGFRTFDEWAAVFADIRDDFEQLVSGEYGYRTRMMGFRNVLELQRMFFDTADVKMLRDLPDLQKRLPKVKTGKPIAVEVPPTAELKRFIQLLQMRYRMIEYPPKKGQDNVLRLSTEGLMASIDLRLVRGLPKNMVPDAPQKVHYIADKVFEVWERTKNNRSTQVVFLDKGTPDSPGFNLYSELKNLLIQKGIPKGEIAFAHEAKNQKQKQELFDRFNAGEIRILIGSTDKLGIGANIQQKLIALHHGHPTYKPDEIEQREGRIVRFGNENKEVEIYTYVTKGSFDERMWQMLTRKQEAIEKLLDTQNTERRIDIDIGEISKSEIMQEMMAIASDNPLAVELNKIQQDLRRIEAFKKGFERQKQSQKADLEANIKNKERLEAAKDDVIGTIETIAEKVNQEDLSLTHNGKAFEKLEDLDAAIKKTLELEESTEFQINGIDFFVMKRREFTTAGEVIYYDYRIPEYAKLYFKKYAGSEFTFGFAGMPPANKSVSGDTNIAVSANMYLKRFKDVNELRGKYDKAINDIDAKIEVVKKRLMEPFPQQEKLDQLMARFNELKQQLRGQEPSDEQQLGNDMDEALEDLGIDEHADIVAAMEDDNLADVPEFTYSDPKLEKDHIESHGLPKKTFWQRLKEKLEALKVKLTRGRLMHLPRTAEFADARFALLRLLRYKSTASAKALRNIKTVIKQLSPKEYNIFERYVLLRDLLEEVKAERQLPGYWTPEAVTRELMRLNAIVDKLPRVKEALAIRKQMWEVIKTEYIQAMKAAGKDVSGKFKKDEYYRHQVLEYAEELARITGSGKKVKIPIWRGFLRKRKGKRFDEEFGKAQSINTMYVQADFEVMAHMLYDTELAKTLARIKEKYDISKRLKAKAKAINEGNAFAALVEAFGETEARTIWNKLKQRQAIAIRKLQDMAEQDNLPVGEVGEWTDTVESLKKGDTGINNLMKYAAWLLRAHPNTEAAKAAGLLFKGISLKKKFVKDILMNLGKYVDWETLVDSGEYAIWHPNDAKTFFTAFSIPEQKAQALLTGMLEQIGISKDDINKIWAVGTSPNRMVLPIELVNQLNDMSLEIDRRELSRTMRKLLTKWKGWTLINPRRFLKYNGRNMSGDAAAVFIGSPSVFKRVPEAVKHLLAYFRTGQPVDERMDAYFEMGGFQTTLQEIEIGEIDKLKEFERHIPSDKPFTKRMLRIPRIGWNFLRLATDFREQILRYAAYLDYLDQIEKNRGKPKNYGASIRAEVDAINDKYEKAFWLSNDLLGAYDDVSIIGNELRSRWYPFWSWKEVNFRRYIRFIKNAAQDGKLMAMIGRQATGVLIRSPLILINVGKFILIAHALEALLYVWNTTFFNDEEEELPEGIRRRPHIILWRKENGEIVYFDRLGSTGDFFEWFGLNEPWVKWNDWQSGKKTIKEIAIEMAKSPVNVIWQGLRPELKWAVELVGGVSTFPDVFRPRMIRDKKLAFFKSLSLENEYIWIMGLPSRGYGSSWEKAAYYTIDAERAAYLDIYDAKMRFKQRKGEQYSGRGGYVSPRSNALYNFKLALKYKDRDAALKYLLEYAQLGGTGRGIARSLESLHPLSGIKKKEWREFIEFLDSEERRKLKLALRHYENTIKMKPNTKRILNTLLNARFPESARKRLAKKYIERMLREPPKERAPSD